MPIQLRQTDSADRLPPQPRDGRPAPYARPALDPAVVLFGGGLLLAAVVILVPLCWWLFRDWIEYGSGGTWLSIVGGLGVAWLAGKVVRSWLFVQVRDIPVSTARLARADAERVIGGLLEVDRTYAGAVVPAQITYSPTYEARSAAPHDEPIEEAEILPEPDALPPPRPDQTMIEALRERGHIDRSGHSLLLGYSADHKPSYIEMQETGFIAIAGHPRKGKSVTAALLVGQAALMGWELVVCDKHGEKADGLLSRLAPLSGHISRAAIAPTEIVKAVDYWHEIIANRLAQPQQSEYRRLLLVIDEFTAMILQEQLPPAALHKLISAAVEAPKVQAHGLIIGHQWSERLLGRYGANLRRVITSRIVHRSDPGDAAFLLPSAYANKAMTLPIGSAIYFGGGDAPVELTIPFVSDRDVTWIADRAPRLTATQPTMPRVDTQAGEPVMAAPGAVVYPPHMKSTNARIAWLLRQRWSYRQIEKELNVSHATIALVSKALNRATNR